MIAQLVDAEAILMLDAKSFFRPALFYITI